jgi:ABC-2 type transport system ATP-binding protein
MTSLAPGTARATAPPALATRGLTKRYGERTVVDRLDLDLPSGVVAGFVGPNGAGKTTTMAMLLGLVRPSAGTAAVLGASIAEPAAYLPRVGALIEHPAFYPSLTGAENLRYHATIARHEHGRNDGRDADDAIEVLLDLVGLGGRGDDRYRSYSLGMKQRLGIAAALLGDPELLILDEPANGLDPEGVREMRSLIGALAGRGRTVLVSSHDLSEVEQVCDWLVLIDQGRCVYQGSTRQLLGGAVDGLAVALADPAQNGRLGQVLAAAGHHVAVRGERLVVGVDAPHPACSAGAGRTRPDGAAGRAPEPDVGSLAATVNRTAFEAGLVLAELSPLRATLEDRYLSLVEEAHR